VLAVLTAADYLADGLKPLIHSPFTISPPDITLRNRDGKTVFIAPHYPLAFDRVRFVGEGVALVVAETLAAAREAAELVEVEYEVLAASAEGSDAAEPGAARIWPEMDSNVALDAEVGDARAPDEAFKRAAHVVRVETKIPRVTGVTMEVRTALAAYEPDSGRITLYAGGGGVVHGPDVHRTSQPPRCGHSTTSIFRFTRGSDLPPLSSTSKTVSALCNSASRVRILVTTVNGWSPGRLNSCTLPSHSWNATAPKCGKVT
jgi:CO/xanthine dehydrogenase Mo-binding subunit